MKRFYKQAGVAEAKGGFAVELDGRAMKTPAKAPLIVPAKALAGAIAAEWDAQDDEVRPFAMPLTGLANAAIDLVSARRAEFVADTAGCIETDLLCYRAETPAELRAEQDEKWQPLLDWAATQLDAPFAVTGGVLPVPQDPAVREAAHAAVDKRDDFGLVGLNKLTHGLGSYVLGLAVAEFYLDAEEAFELSVLDERWQESLWGEDVEASQRRANLRADVLAAAEFLRLSCSQ